MSKTHTLARLPTVHFSKICRATRRRNHLVSQLFPRLQASRPSSGLLNGQGTSLSQTPPRSSGRGTISSQILLSPKSGPCWDLVTVTHNPWNAACSVCVCITPHLPSARTPRFLPERAPPPLPGAPGRPHSSWPRSSGRRPGARHDARRVREPLGSYASSLRRSPCAWKPGDWPAADDVGGRCPGRSGTPSHVRRPWRGQPCDRCRGKHADETMSARGRERPSSDRSMTSRAY